MYLATPLNINTFLITTAYFIWSRFFRTDQQLVEVNFHSYASTYKNQRLRESDHNAYNKSHLYSKGDRSSPPMSKEQSKEERKTTAKVKKLQQKVEDLWKRKSNYFWSKKKYDTSQVWKPAANIIQLANANYGIAQFTVAGDSCVIFDINDNMTLITQINLGSKYKLVSKHKISWWS